MITRLKASLRPLAGVAVALAVALSAPLAALDAQTGILCAGETSVPAENPACTVTITGSDPVQTLPIRVRAIQNNAPAPGAIVRFRATSGTMLPDSTTADGEGYAQTLWYRAGGTDQAVIAVDVRTAAGSALRQVRATRQPAPRFALRQHSGNGASWFEKTPLRHPVVVEILRADAPNDASRYITTNDSCNNIRVAFTRIASGTTTPDTATATLAHAEVGDAPDRHSCFARTYWTLGEGAGRRHVRASLVGGTPGAPSSNTVFEAYARAMPRLIGGVVVTYNRGYKGAKPAAERTVRVERTQLDGTKISFDSTFSTGRDTVDDVGGHYGPAAFAGVSTPVIPSLHRFAITFGVDPGSIDRNWYMGASLLRIGGALAVEALPIDIHVLGHWGRTRVLEDVSACETLGDCRTEDDVRWIGFAAMLSVDASSLLTELINKLAGS